MNFNQRRNLPEFATLIKEQGGFGRMQLLGYLLIVAGINTFGWQLYNVSYFTLYPEYTCDELVNDQWIPQPSYYSNDC